MGASSLDLPHLVPRGLPGSCRGAAAENAPSQPQPSCFQRRNPDSGILARKNQYLLMGGQILLPNLLILRNSYITWCCAPGYGGPCPWELRILSKVNPTKRALGFFENPKIPPPGFWPSDDSENRFGFSNGHIGSSVIQNDGSRTNSAVRTSRWVCRPLGTNFSPLSAPHEKIQN